MSRNDRAVSDNVSIDAILKSLSSRPNVQSTLILSRRDGSIIRATGFRDTPSVLSAVVQSSPDTSNVLNKPEEHTERPTTSKSGESVGSLSTPALPSAAERLAQSIYEFVKHSEHLAAAVSLSDSPGDSYGSSKPYEPGQTPSKETGAGLRGADTEQQVQLLRMRTRKQEIIIFPDTHYLSCVLQNVGRTANNENGR